MRSALKDKFKNNALVKPLYKKLNHKNKIKPKTLIPTISTFKLDGHVISVKRDVTNSGEANKLNKNHKRNIIFSCDTCKIYSKFNNFEKISETIGNTNDKYEKCAMIDTVENSKLYSGVNIQNKYNKLVQTDSSIYVIDKVPSTWLRLYPLPKLPQESLYSVIFRCIVCQIGISSFLVLWTIIFIFVIHSFEGPYEIKLSTNFQNLQNQLVIDLATELRQITPLSPRWKAAIEQRIEQARQITSKAMLHGARIHPGCYWDLPGTFLFTVNIMTALGFGAPVPQTIEGRMSALIYAILAVPSHVFLVLNASTSIVAHADLFIKQIRSSFQEKRLITRSPSFGNPKYSHNTLLKTPKKCVIGKHITFILGVLGVCRCVPLAAVLYYVVGACIFGVLRNREPLGIAMFPLEFTTSGGLDRVQGHARILYAFYVEGAMILIACTIATMRRHGTSSIDHIFKKYRLFTSNDD